VRSETAPTRRVLKTLRQLLPYWKSPDGYKWSTKLADANLAFGLHEKWLEDEILVPGDCFVDIGSHVGKYAVRASRMYRQVIAFEPNPKTCRILRANIALNKVKNVKVHQVALSNKTGTATFYEGKRPSSSGLDQPVKEYLKGTIVKVRTETLDKLETRPSLIKIDTEGHELPVLEGSLKTLKACHPKLVVEIHRPDDIQSIRHLLSTCGYENFRVPRTATTVYHQTFLIAT